VVRFAVAAADLGGGAAAGGVGGGSSMSIDAAITGGVDTPGCCADAVTCVGPQNPSERRPIGTTKMPAVTTAAADTATSVAVVATEGPWRRDRIAPLWRGFAGGRGAGVG
jgi:hypothetical protein